ncbi:MAG: 2,3-bisphosphoglycerate-independent phosphoglycerate mutase [Candidatus Bathyarchaeia archaeon]
MKLIQSPGGLRLKMKGIMVICDGMGDRPHSEHGGMTPLEAAETPNMDAMADEGLVGFMDVVAPGVPPGSDVAHLSLFGYDPHEYYTGRGGFEAVGAGLSLSPGDVAFRCNFATVDDDLTVMDRRAGRIKEDADKLMPAIRGFRLDVEGLTYEFHHTVEHRGVLVFRGKNLSRHVSDTDPHKVGERILKSTPLEPEEAAERTAEALNQFTLKSFEALKDHPVNLKRIQEGKPPANIILSRGAGTLPTLQTIPQKYGVKASAIAAVALVRGICKVVGMELINVPGATGGLDTNYSAKAEAALKSIKENDLTILHVKATDVASHDGDFEEKRRAIEKIDEMIGVIRREVRSSNVFVAVTADHTTPIAVRDHMGDPVPFLLWGPGVFRSGVGRFCERTARKGNAGRLRGPDLIRELMNYMGFSQKFGF